MRDDGDVGVVGAVAARRNIYRHVDVADLALQSLLDAEAGVGYGDVHRVEVDGRNLEDAPAAHDAEAAQAGGALLALPLYLVVFIDVPQVVWAAVFQDLPVGRVRLALECFGMEDGGGSESVLGVSAHVDVELAALGLGADAQVLQRAADDAHRVTLEVGESDEYVGCGYRLGHVCLFQQVALRDVHPEVGGAEPAVGAYERAAQRGGAVAVALGGQQYVELAGTRAVWRIGRSGGVADERPAAEFLDAVGQRARIDGAKVSGVVPLAAVYLDCHNIVGADHFVQLCGVEDRCHLRHQAGLCGFRMSVHPIDFGIGHFSPSLIIFCPCIV